MQISIIYQNKIYTLGEDTYGIDGVNLFEFDPEGGILNIAELKDCKILLEMKLINNA